MDRVRVLIVDDDDFVRETYRMFLRNQPEYVVVGEAPTGADGIAQAERLQPDVILMDLQMPGLTGIDATRAIMETAPQTTVVVLTTFDAPDWIAGALRAGAAGYLLKDASGPQILGAIRQARAGDMPLSPAVRRALVASMVEPAKRPGVHVTPRETELLRYLAQGMSNQQIAGHMHLSEGSVKQYLTAIGAKMQAHSRTQILVKAIQLGIVDPLTLPD